VVKKKTFDVLIVFSTGLDIVIEKCGNILIVLQNIRTVVFIAQTHKGTYETLE
jgi:hypothetical protein